MAEVIIKKLKKIYPNGFKAVHEIDLHIKDGEFMVFVGPSGCSKSTTLRMIAGLEEVSDGEIYIGNRCVNQLPSKDRGVAMVFQNYALYPHMTVYDNMAFGLKLNKTPKNEIDRRVRDAAEKLKIKDLLNRKPKEMSGGQQQRVAVGRAIVRKPDVFLFDEPLSNLDAKLRVSMRLKITQLHKQLKDEGSAATMIYVTHDQIEAMTMGDRICVLNSGNIMQVDTPINLYKRPANKFVASFIGSPAMNIIEGKIIEKNGKAAVDISGSLLELPEKKEALVRNYIGKNIWFGIRPEDISICKEDLCFASYVYGYVTIVELMGNEEFIHYITPGEEFISRISSDEIQKLIPGETCKFFYNMEKCHIFDFETEKNIILDEETPVK